MTCGTGLCQHCGCEFVIERFKYSDRQKYCSDNCRFEQYKQKLRENTNRKYKSSVLRDCDWCGENFLLHDKQKRFCCKNCKAEWHKNRLREETAAKREVITLQCPTCGKNFTPNKTLRQQHCSRKCRELISRKMYKALSTALKCSGKKKNARTYKLLGFTPDQLRTHVENYHNWESIKGGTWHLDHIFPIKAFMDHNIKDIALICALDNLQPLTGEDNCKKNDNYDKDKFAKWLTEKAPHLFDEGLSKNND